MLNNEKIFIEYLNEKIKELNKKFKDIEKNSVWDKYEEWNSKQFLIFLKSLIVQKWWISNILMNYKETIDWNDFSSNDREKHILWLVEIDKLKQRDYKRYIIGTVPFANYLFSSILNSWENSINLKVDFLDELNPFKQKYNNVEINNLETKFECLRDYLNEVSFALDAASIWGMTWATDFLQLYKHVMDDEIIKENNDRKDIINALFKVLNSKLIKEFISNYNQFIELLEDKKVKEDKKLPRLYNRLWFIFSYILNNQNPKEFPMYFSATRNTLRVWWTEGYQNIAKIYKEIIDNNDFIKYIDDYLKWVWIDENSYWFKDIIELSFNKDLFENHAKYRFFQDLCWVIARNVLDGQDYVNNLWKSKTFKFEELKNKIYPFEKDQDWNLIENWNDEKNKKITFWEIINVDYLISEWYITEISPWEYQVIKTDTFFIRDREEKEKTEETN